MSGFQENGVDIVSKLRLRYAVNPVVVSGAGTLTVNVLGTGYSGYLLTGGVGSFTVTTGGAYNALLVNRGNNGYGPNGGNGGEMKHIFGYLPPGIVNYFTGDNINSETTFYGVTTTGTVDALASNFYNYAETSGGNGSNWILGTIASAGNNRPTLNVPFNTAKVGGGGGAGDTFGGGGGFEGIGGSVNGAGYSGGSGNGASSSSYGGGGGGYGSAYGGSPGSGGLGCIILIPLDLTTNKDVSSATVISGTLFPYNTYQNDSITAVFDMLFVSYYDPNVAFKNYPSNFELIDYPQNFLINSAYKINGLSIMDSLATTLGFRKMPFKTNASYASVYYGFTRVNKYYYLTLQLSSTIELVLTKTFSGLQIICCGGGGAGGFSDTQVSKGGGGGGGGGIIYAAITNINGILNSGAYLNFVMGAGGYYYDVPGPPPYYIPFTYSVPGGETSFTINNNKYFSAYGGSNGAYSNTGSAGGAGGSATNYNLTGTITTTISNGGAGAAGVAGTTTPANGGSTTGGKLTLEGGFITNSKGFGGGGGGGNNSNYGKGANIGTGGTGGVATGSTLASYATPVGWGAGAGGKNLVTGGTPMSGNGGMIYLVLIE